MEENHILEGTFSKRNIFVIVPLALSIVSFFISFGVFIFLDLKYTGIDMLFVRYMQYPMRKQPVIIGLCFYFALLLIPIILFFFIRMNFCKLSISDKKINGKTSFGRKVDLQIDKISSVSTCFPKGIIVSTSSKSIKFWLLKNQEEVYQAISDLVKKRQDSLVEALNIKVLIKSEQYNVKKLFKTLVIVGLVLTILVTIISISVSCNYYNSHYGEDHKHDSWCYEYLWRDEFYADKLGSGLKEWKMSCYQVVYDNAFSYAISNYFKDYEFILCSIPFAAFALIGGLIYLWLRRYELTITDKRIYGNVAWGKRVDLPVDSVSATATINHLKGVSISTSSGKIGFLAIKNADAIYKVIGNLLIERQQEKEKNVAVASFPKSDSADELKKFKELLDMGIISQEEFDAKKKQLLGL